MQSTTDFKAFYEDWALHAFEDPRRENILEWKADEMASLIKEYNLHVDSAMELGCAEGIVLNRLGSLLNIDILYGVDISQNFISIGQQRYPHIDFLNMNWEHFSESTQKVDLLIVSDFIEHLPNPDIFLEKIKLLASFFIFKIPLEKCWTLYLYRILGRRAEIGPHHPSGHLHEYDINQALDLLQAHSYQILKTKSLTTPIEVSRADLQRWYTHPSVVVEKIVNLLPINSWRIGLIGGSLFVLCTHPES